MPSPEPILRETPKSQCPKCRGQRITPMGRVLATATSIWEKSWCEACGTVFWFVRKAP